MARSNFNHNNIYVRKLATILKLEKILKSFKHIKMFNLSLQILLTANQHKF